MGRRSEIRWTEGIKESDKFDCDSAVRADLFRARAAARAWAETHADATRVDLAASFAWRALQAMAADRAVSAFSAQAGSYGRLDSVADQLAGSIGEAAAKLPLDEGLHFVTGLYPAMLPQGVRSQFGAFYTPPALVSQLFDRAEDEGLDWRAARILDPAAGGGAFLIRAIRRIIDVHSGCEPAFLLAQIGNRLTGFELDARAADIAHGAIEILLSDLAKAAGRPVPRIITVCDTLDIEPEPVFDLVIGNPPYGRVTLSFAQRRRYARGLYGHANLYGLFTDAALRWTKPGGLIGYLTPTSFLAGQYFSALRELLAKEAPPVAIDFVHARRGVFEDVLQETLLAVYKRGVEPRRAQIRYLLVGNEGEAALVRNGTVGLPANHNSPWLAPRAPEHGRLIAHAESMNERLADWGYSVSTGPLVWNRFKDQLRTRPDGPAVHPLIWAEAVSSDGRFVCRARKKNHPPYFKVEPDHGWLLVRQPCILVQRTTAKEQARRLIAAELPAAFVAAHHGVVVENHLNMVRPNERPKVPLGVVAALLNSCVVDELFRCMSGSVAVSAFELEALPLPAAAATGELARLVSEGGSITEIESECARLYDR